MPPRSFMTVLKTFVSDLRGSVRLAANARSRFRLSMDFALSRFIGLVPGRQRNRVREVRLCGDIKIRYRLNRAIFIAFGKYGLKKPIACLLRIRPVSF